MLGKPILIFNPAFHSACAMQVVMHAVSTRPLPLHSDPRRILCIPPTGSITLCFVLPHEGPHFHGAAISPPKPHVRKTSIPVIPMVTWHHPFYCTALIRYNNSCIRRMFVSLHVDWNSQAVYSTMRSCFSMWKCIVQK